jgi:hypothetical protein
MQLACKLLPVRAGQDEKQAIPNLRRCARVNQLCGAPQQDYEQALEYRTDFLVWLQPVKTCCVQEMR